MKRHMDEGLSPGMMPSKDVIYSRPNPASPPAHIMGPTGAPSILSNVASVQSILHMTSQPSPSGPPAASQPMYPKDANMTAVQYQYSSGKPVVPPSTIHMRHKVHTSTTIAVPGPGTPPGTSSQQHFQRLKVEDALSYLDQVKFKFGNQPQVYNDFLDIMKEFKSQSIDTPGVIQRVSNLFKGHPELIVGFNTFLPPGYKIEVQSNEQGYAFQVSVSMPSPTATSTTLIQSSHHPIANQSETIAVVPGPVKQLSSATIIPRSCTPPPIPPNYPHQSGPPPPPSNNLLTQSAFGMLPISQQQAHLAVSHALNNVDSNHPTPQSQPVEFNHAINYVNKIKNRFQGQPDKYKKFLEILHTYQKEQRNAKEGACPPAKHLTEAEVYSQVSKLFEHQEDLLAEFGQFLPDATSHLNAKVLPGVEHVPPVKKSTSTLKTMTLPRDSSGSERDTPRASGPKPTPSLKRSSSFSTTPKKHKVTSLRDVSIAEAGKFASLTDYAFFDKVRKALKSQDVYENFLRCLSLYNNEIISKMELTLLVSQFLARSPELLRWFKDFLGVSEPSGLQSRMDLIPASARQDRPTGDLATEIDYSTCKRLGASYCALPKSYVLPKSSGRTALCREVLNDTWVSFPSWSEDSTFVTSRKTVFEEYIYRCEDERFELDVVIETNGATIRVLEAVQKKIARMSPEEAQKFRLDDCLGGNSPTIQIRAISRVYGDKAPDMIDGLKKSPLVAIPVVLRRLRAKEDEWREAQKGFNKIWRDQNEKFYLKSLDHQGMNFKQTDIKALGSKSLYNDIESLYEERNENNEDGATDSGPHLILPYKDKTILDDAANLLIHHAKRITGLQKEDKHKIKVILRHFLPDLFHHSRQELSDDEKDEFEDEGESTDRPKASNCTKPEQETVVKDDEMENESYSLFMTNNKWYLFFRLHQILCERLTKMYDTAQALAIEDANDKSGRKEAASVVLRLKPKLGVDVSEYYPTLLDMVKSVLDGNMENTVYEDTLREMFGIHAYIAFTLDKVVTYAVRQLQHIVCDETPMGCMELYSEEAKRGGAGGLAHTAHQRASLEAAYQKKLEQLLSDENCFKIYIYHKDCRITMELLETELDEPENNGDTLKWSQYRETFVDSMRNFVGDDDPNVEKPLFMPRNVRAWKKIHAKITDNAAKMDVDDEPMDLDDERPGERPEKPLSRMGDQPQSDLMIQENAECRFNLHSYKILFVINKDNLLYKKNALSLARKKHPRISKAKGNKMKQWLAKWVEANCSEVDTRSCSDWMMGKGPDMMLHKTEIVNTNDLTKPPYVPYNRYTVQTYE